MRILGITSIYSVTHLNFNEPLILAPCHSARTPHCMCTFLSSTFCFNSINKYFLIEWNLICYQLTFLESKSSCCRLPLLLLSLLHTKLKFIYWYTSLSPISLRFGNEFVSFHWVNCRDSVLMILQVTRSKRDKPTGMRCECLCRLFFFAIFCHLHLIHSHHIH